MARGRRVDIDAKIAGAQEKVVRAKAGYDRACKELEALMEKRDAMRRDELWRAVVDSELSYAEILEIVRKSKGGAGDGQPL